MFKKVDVSYKALFPFQNLTLKFFDPWGQKTGGGRGGGGQRTGEQSPVTRFHDGIKHKITTEYSELGTRQLH